MNKPFSEMTLAELVLARGQIVGYIDVEVARRRRAGNSWASIAGQLGVSTSEAHRRYHWLDKIAQPGDGA